MNYKSMDSSERILELLEEVSELRELLEQKSKMIDLLGRICEAKDETIKTLKEGMLVEEERIANLKELLEKSQSLTDRASEQADKAIQIAESLTKQ